MKISGGGRSSGKTYRQMLLALEAASSGNIVYYWSVDNHSDYYWRLAKGLAPDINYIDRQYQRINFPNGGSLRLMSDTPRNRDKVRGLVNYKEFIDD